MAGIEVDDVFDLLAQALTLFAVQLDKWSGPIPWPLLVGAFFLPIVVALRVAVWISRGRFWPVQCKYYYTQQSRTDKACRQIVPGEWSYCRHHKYHKRMANGHQCDPSVRRWRRKIKGGTLVDRDDIRGVGFVALLSNRETLLFYKGVAKDPVEVFRGLRRIPQQFASGFRALKAMSWKQVFKPPVRSPEGSTATHGCPRPSRDLNSHDWFVPGPGQLHRASAELNRVRSRHRRTSFLEAAGHLTSGVRIPGGSSNGTKVPTTRGGPLSASADHLAWPPEVDRVC